MKKILISVLTFLSLSTFASNDASLILEYNYTNDVPKYSLNHLESDTDFCCYFDVVACKNTTIQSDIIKVIDKKSGVCLGIIHGKPNKEFIMLIYGKYLTPALVDDITTKILTAKQ